MENDKPEAKIISKWQSTPTQRGLIKVEHCSPGRKSPSTSMCINALQHFHNILETMKEERLITASEL